MKKFLAMVMVVMLLVALTACGEEAASEATGGLPAEESTAVSSVEFLTEPVEVKFVAGYAEDADGNMEYLYETFPLTSILLDSHGATVVGYAGMNTPDMTIQVFLQDSGSITLYGDSGGENGAKLPESKLVTDVVIDLEQVAYLILPDGTKLEAPK